MLDNVCNFLAFLTDYVIEYPLQLRQQFYLGPDLDRSCVNFTAIDDSVLESEDEVAYISLKEGDKTNVRLISGQLEVYILDDDSK